MGRGIALVCAMSGYPVCLVDVSHDVLRRSFQGISVIMDTLLEHGLCFKPSALLRQKVEAGELGIVAGRGWYDYTGKAPAYIEKKRDSQLIQMIKFLDSLGLVRGTEEFG